ncbi:MAG: beta-N-acetylhexosaminidase [Rhizobiaceae bacterium]
MKAAKLRIMEQKAMICGLHGLEMNEDELAFFKEVQPWGFILFARNVDTPEQLMKLTASLRAAVGRDDAPILVDQEGGRVQRLRPPHWEKYPPAAAVGNLYKQDNNKGRRAAWLLSRLLAFDLLAMGITVDCLPVLDVPSPDGHDCIGDRAYGATQEQVATLGRSVCEGIMAGGVMPVIKHIPGHGRANVDSHFKLPVVEESFETLAATDFKPFLELKHIPMAMTAHVIYSALDPNNPATTSKLVMDQIIRGHLGYDGLIMCDDITMNALSGDLTERTNSIFAAGCDIVLHCTGEMEEMKEVAAATPMLSGKAEQRAKVALVGIGETDGMKEADCRAEFADLMGQLLLAEAGQADADPTNYGPTSGQNGKIA